MLPSDPRAIIALLDSRRTAPETLVEIRAAYRDRFDAADVQAALAAHRTSKHVLLRHLAGSDARGVRLALAQNPNTPADVLGKLALDPLQAVRVAVATHASTPSDVLLAMAQSTPTAQVARVLADSAALRSTAAGRAAAARLAGELAASPSPKRATVKERVAALFASTPTRRELDALRNDGAANVRWAAVIRGYELGVCSLEVVAALFCETPQSRQLLAERWQETKDPRLIDVMIDAGCVNQLATAVRNGEITDPVHLEGIILAKLVEVCWAIATTVELDAVLLRYLSTVPILSRAEFYEEDLPKGPGIVVVDMSQSTGYQPCVVQYHTQVIVALHPLTPPDVLDRLVKARSRHVRVALAQRPFDEGLERLARDEEPTVRAAVAASPGLTIALRNQFGEDSDPQVQAALRRNPAGRL